MRKVIIIALVCALLGPVSIAAQKDGQPQQPPQAGKKLEALFNTAEMPFTKSEEGTYIAVISVDQNESERFHVGLSYLGNEPNDERYQIIRMYFLLAQVPKGASFAPALIKQINEWNVNLTMGRVIAVGNVIMYTSSSWLARTNADTLALDAALGHYASQDLRKEIAPYLKQ
ncbi:MAG: hypothetical protein ACJ71U_14765 [Terriglobales bacterium]